VSESTSKVAITYQKTKYQPTTDTLRVFEKYRNCRYANISQLFGGVQKYGYVGDIKGYRAAKKPVLIVGIQT